MQIRTSLDPDSSSQISSIKLPILLQFFKIGLMLFANAYSTQGKMTQPPHIQSQFLYSLNNIWNSFFRNMLNVLKWKHFRSAIYLNLLIKFLASAQGKRKNLVVFRLHPSRDSRYLTYKFWKLNLSADFVLAQSSQKCCFTTPALWPQQKLALMLTFLLLLTRFVPFLPSHSPLQVVW